MIALIWSENLESFFEKMHIDTDIDNMESKKFISDLFARFKLNGSIYLIESDKVGTREVIVLIEWKCL